MAIRAVVSILSELYYAQVEALWDLLEKECGLPTMQEGSIPHFSWQIADDYDADELHNDLQLLVKETGAFEVATNGLGVFTGDRLVIYLQVVKTPQLASMHQVLWKRTQPYSTDLSPLYAPNAWMPHITLASEDVDVNALECIMRKLGERELNWKMNVDNFSIVVQEEERGGYVHTKYKFRS
ncbi:MAG: 2'-5' RNA ligase family protein [Chloroflexi bacterium]|nr:MAG: 2'-5' RNA ligase family protein [Chloroflexota bacterium]MBL1195962.1 2'-5' RNA ligase family protein [Chloroflexota bacterium]NOH13256.1 2'-5' RNA ligase family protein [Chloroflexota bacterium]